MGNVVTPMIRETPQMFSHEVEAEQPDEAKFRRNYRLRMWDVKQ